MPDLPHRHRLLLEADLTQPLVEPDPEPLAKLRARGRRQLRPTIRALAEAGPDRRVGGLVVKVGGPLSWAAAQELRMAVASFRATGKPAVAWAESFVAVGMAPYLLACGFDQIWLQPGGEVGLIGVSAEATFLRGALDKLGVRPQLEQRYEYKNAANQVMRSDFTPEHRESLDAVISSIYEDAVTGIAGGRRLTPERVRELVDGGPYTAAEALEHGLVDRLGYRDEVYAELKDRIAAPVSLLFADRWQPRRRPRLPSRNRRGVALIEARGAIGPGRSRRGAMGRSLGSDTVAAQLRAAQADERTAAVVLHVDSPGGSAVASEVIWREVVRLRESGRPVIVSMGAVAASGGYYIACPADVIVALPATLTGSIGVFGGKVVVADLLERAGVRSASVQRGTNARMFSARTPFSESELERLNASLDAIYSDFVGKVAEGRGRTVEQIEAVARGRVWTGRDALAVGLVDELGGLREAVRIARHRADLPDRAPVVRPGQLPLLARAGTAKNSEDPRAMLAGGLDLLRLDDLTRALGLPQGRELLMPAVRLR